MEQMRHICKCLRRIWCMYDFEMWTMLSSILTDMWRSSLMIAVTVLIFVSVTIEAGCPLGGSTSGNSWPFVKKLCQWRINCANKETLMGQDNHLGKPLSSLICLLCRFTHPPKKFNDIPLFRLQIHFSTPNFAISKNMCDVCNFTSPNHREF